MDGGRVEESAWEERKVGSNDVINEGRIKKICTLLKSKVGFILGMQNARNIQGGRVCDGISH